MLTGCMQRHERRAAWRGEDADKAYCGNAMRKLGARS
jgi:hypothetical protein